MKQEPVEWENEDEDEDEEDDDDDDDEEEEEENSDDDGNTLITVMIDRNILDCPVCHKPLKSSLFQCTNGHMMCSQCCTKLQSKCPTCTLSICSIHCLVLESIQSILGCSERDGEKGIKVRMEPAVLDCPTCFEPLQLPLFKCTNGHIICFQCCNELQDKCTICTRSISRIHCLMLESVIESNSISLAPLPDSAVNSH